MLFFSTPCKSLLPLLFLLYFGTHQLVTAQNATERRRFRPYNYDNNNINYPLYLGLALAISIIFIVVTYLIIKFYCKPQETPRHLLLVLPNNQTSSGLDPTILETFPIFKYSNVPGHSNGTGHIECSVCLSPFEVDEMLRSLPKCNHVFHVSCLDPWLKDHNTCPLCRMNLVLEPSELAKAKMVRVDHESGGSEREGLGNHRVLEVRVEGDIEEGQYAIAKYKRWNEMGPAVEANWDKGDGEIIGKFKRSSSTL